MAHQLIFHAHFFGGRTVEAPKDYQIKSKWTGIFTHLWSYSFENADFVESYFNPGRQPGSFISNILTKPAHTIDEKNIFRQQGLAPIAWIVSSCTSENGRHFYVKQLLKYINVDIYGHCMRNKEWPVHPGKFQILQQMENEKRENSSY